MTGIFMIGARRATQRALEDIARGKNSNDDQMRLLLHCSNPFIHQYPGSYGEESSLLPVHCDKYTEVGSIVAPSHRRCVVAEQHHLYERADIFCHFNCRKLQLPRCDDSFLVIF